MFEAEAEAESISSFHRMDRIHALLTDCRDNYNGEFSILELGGADGYSVTKMLYAARYLGMEDRVTVHAFDAGSHSGGESPSRYEHLTNYCAARYPNFRIHAGYLHETLTPALLESLRNCPPMLVRIECDDGELAMMALELLMGYLPDGCRFTGEESLVQEINSGRFGRETRLARDWRLGFGGDRVYRLVRRMQPS